MSVQSDCEMMSLRAMEEYSKKHHLTGDEAIKLFHKYQVYEKIMKEYNQNFTVMRVFDALLQGKIERGEIKL